QSIAMDIVQKRKLEDWTIGVLTKADLLVYHGSDDDDSDGDSRLEELHSKLHQQSTDVVPLHPHGYVAVMNKRPKKQLGSRYDELVTQAAREREWFDSRGFDCNTDARVATNGL